MKFLLIAIMAIIASRVFFGRWPWQFWQASERSQAEARARGLLGVDRGADYEDVIAAHRRALRDAHPDRGGSVEQVHELDRARDTLLEQMKRAKR